MKYHTHSGRTTRPTGQTLMAFAGLGFDLAPVLDRAAGMCLRQVRAKRPANVKPAPGFRVSGYLLMLSLGREIRAR